MTNEALQTIFNQFKHGSEFVSFQELVSGHINDTYLIKTAEKPYYILQRINHHVFKDVPGLVNNKVLVSKHIKKKLSYLSDPVLARVVLTFIQAQQGAYYYKDSDGSYWNVMRFIHDSITYERVTSREIAYEGGKLIGEFLNLTSDFDVSKLIDVIPRFHDMSFRYAQFEDALKNASPERLEQAQSYIDKVEALREEMHILQHLKASGKIPLRVTHNDTKISNVLFDTNNKGLCVIDTDTVMPGIAHYDFGDAIRTICNTANEDEQDLSLVKFHVPFYKAYKKGFLEKTAESLSDLEIKYLPLSAKTMIFIMALRFLTDFLNNDIYYKIKYPNHNLARSKNQFKLLESLSNQINDLE